MIGVNSLRLGGLHLELYKTKFKDSSVYQIEWSVFIQAMLYGGLWA